MQGALIFGTPAQSTSQCSNVDLSETIPDELLLRFSRERIRGGKEKDFFFYLSSIVTISFCVNLSSFCLSALPQWRVWCTSSIQHQMMMVLFFFILLLLLLLLLTATHKTPHWEKLLKGTRRYEEGGIFFSHVISSTQRREKRRGRGRRFFFDKRLTSLPGVSLANSSSSSSFLFYLPWMRKLWTHLGGLWWWTALFLYNQFVCMNRERERERVVYVIPRWAQIDYGLEQR